MSFPDFIDTNPSPPSNFPTDPISEQSVPFSQPFEPIIDSIPQQSASPLQSIPIEVVDQEEQQRIEQRQQEEAERRKVITSKMELELRLKNESREKASAYMREFENKRMEEVGKRKEMNVKNEKDFVEERKLIKEGKKNSWECVVDNINVKESEYKGTKDVSRMKKVILERKNDKGINKEGEMVFK